jgi:hypothetical protein
MALPAHALQVVQVRLKSVIDKGHFTLVAETVFLPYSALYCSGVTEICHVTLPAHAQCAVDVRLNSVKNERHFTLVAASVFRPYLA